MRLALLVAVSLGVLACADTGSDEVSPVTVQWMDWPAEVEAGQPFRARLVVWGVCAANPRFRDGARADESAVTFAPYFLINKDPILCLEASQELLLVVAIDTAGTAPGLPATFPRTYEMRAAASTYVTAAVPLGSIPVRTFGEVRVEPGGTPTSRRNAAGIVSLERDEAGCARIRPFGLYHPSATLALDDQADTVGLSQAFVRGYIQEKASPVCGETRVFHLVSRN